MFTCLVRARMPHRAGVALLSHGRLAVVEEENGGGIRVIDVRGGRVKLEVRHARGPRSSAAR